MQNKKVIRLSEKKEGTFTTVSYTILHNPKLLPVDKMLLISILSDSDNFQLNQNLYATRLGVARKTIGESIKRLVKQGYMKEPNTKSKGKGNGFITYYTISEYGNLSTNEEETIANNIENTTIDEEQKYTSTNDLNNNKSTNENIVGSIDNHKIIDQIALQLDSVTIKHFPNIPQDILVDYFDTMIDALQNGEVKIKDITDEKIIKSISKLYSEPNKITIQQAEKIIQEKMTGGTQNQRNDTLKKVKEWFVDNECIATEEQIKHKTFTTHNNSKTANRVIDQRYND